MDYSSWLFLIYEKGVDPTNRSEFLFLDKVIEILLKTGKIATFNVEVQKNDYC